MLARATALFAVAIGLAFASLAPAARQAKICPVHADEPYWARQARMTVLVDSVLLSGKRAIRTANRCRRLSWIGRPALMIRIATAEIAAERRRVAPLVVIGIGYNSLFQRHRHRYGYWSARWDREAHALLRTLRRKGARQFVWVTLREPTPRTVPRRSIGELRYYSWYFPYVNERLRLLDRRRDDLVLANWTKAGDRKGITYDSIHLNSRGGPLMARTINSAIRREARRQAGR